jgi:two-component sensor histidine kinase
VIDDAWMKSITWSEEHLELMRALNASSAMWVPLTAHGKIVGSAIFAHSDSGRHFTELDLSLGVELGRRVGLAVLHARQYEALQTSAAKLRDMTMHQRVLIDELNHRVKNTLAIVQAMTSQTLRGSSPEAAERSLTARLAALAEAHDLLTRDNWSGADVADIVAAVARSHEARPGTRFRINGPSVRLEPRLALSLAMTLHELGTNAIKYGALSNDSGVVDVRWAVVEESPQLFSLEWHESGGPPVSPPSHRGFGSRLIEIQSGAEPGSKFETRYEPTGLRFQLSVRLGAANGPESRGSTA